MPASNKRRPPYLWTELSEMERIVWASSFAGSGGSSEERAHVADETVNALRSLEPKRNDEVEPEYKAAYARVQMDFAEFEPWYRVQIRIRHGWEFSYKDPTRVACEKAFERYRMGLADF